MRMTIDKCLKKLAHERQCFIDECYQNDGELEAYDMAISTMHKYQKIQEIVKEWRKNGMDYDSCDAMDNIERVIEDGNVD